MTQAPDPEIAALAARIQEGDRRALGRGLTLLEDGAPAAAGALASLAFPAASGAVRIGFTGPPGAGKSTLIAEVAKRLRRRGRKVGILAVDPTSPFTGGALLGDRVRMHAVAADPGVFVRSMAARGHRGGLAASVAESADVLAFAGYDRILVETVGSGQSEVAVAGAVDLVVVVLVPEAGDAVQSMKAGPIEIGDVLLVNKADRPGADGLATELRAALELMVHEGAPPPVILTDATSGAGVEELVETLEALAATASTPGVATGPRRRQAIRAHLLALLAALLERRAAIELAPDLERAVADLAAGRITPRAAATKLAAKLIPG
jgi:LAO/AO transport system kinase